MIEMPYHAFFHQPFCQLLWRLTGFKFINDSHPDQIREVHLYRKATAGPSTGLTMGAFVFNPGFKVINISSGDLSTHGHATGLSGIFAAIIAS